MKYDYFIKKVFLFVLISNVICAFGQDTVAIAVNVYQNDADLPLPPVIVVNKRTKTGAYYTSNRFKTNMLYSDTLLLSVYGFRFKEISLHDSLLKKEYKINVVLEQLNIVLDEVKVYPNKSLNRINLDKSKLGYFEPNYTVVGINAAASPITYLYERFSKFAKSKRKVALWESEDLKRRVLKDLFRIYIKYDIMDLNDEEFDDFINYLNFTDEFIREASQLELVLAIQGKYKTFKYRWK